MAALEAYTKPQSNQILARYQLRCLKQRDRSLEEFVTEAWLLIEDGGYDPAVKENTLRDTLVVGVASDKVRKDALGLGNGLTFKQVYDLTKVDESTKAQMKIVSKGDQKFDLHTVQRASGQSTRPPPRQNFKHQALNGDQNKKIRLEENLFDSNSNQSINQFQMQALRQQRPLRKSVLATTPSKGPPDREQPRVPRPGHPPRG